MLIRKMTIDKVLAALQARGGTVARTPAHAAGGRHSA